jgi:acetyltransferase-like isoleucine patch superfamily enzyme
MTNHVFEARSPPAVNRLDRLVRRLGMVTQTVVALLLFAVGASAFAVALAPSVALFIIVMGKTAHASMAGRVAAISLMAGAGFFLSGLTLLVVVPIYNFLLPTRVQPFRGGYFTLAAVTWYLHNGLFYLVRYTFLPFVTFTPFGTFFLRAMGMTVGQRVQINTDFISDPCLITLGDDCVLGGSVRIFAHYAGGGHLNIAPVTIGERATIGVNATIMGNVIVGPRAVILPHSVLLPGSRVGAGERWGGVPARLISDVEMNRLRRYMASKHRKTP